MANITTIQTAIQTKLQAISELHGVYTYEIAKPTNGQYPFATITFLSSEAVFGDTIRNERTYSFVVRVYQERTEPAFGASKAERIMRGICDQIIDAFDLDTTLNNTVKYVKPISVDLDYIDREIGDTRLAEFKLDCVTIVPSS